MNHKTMKNIQVFNKLTNKSESRTCRRNSRYILFFITVLNHFVHLRSYHTNIINYLYRTFHNMSITAQSASQEKQINNSY